MPHKLNKETDATAMVQKNIATSLTNLLRAWEELAPDVVFANMTLDQFRAATVSAFETRAKIAWIKQEHTAVIAARAAADHEAASHYLLAVHSIKGSPTFGEDSALYRSLGYTTKSERKSGLTRKGQPDGAQAS